jgi:peptidoglycan/xylan/chitin deacetylase (PgdA/CDA1 family)
MAPTVLLYHALCGISPVKDRIKAPLFVDLEMLRWQLATLHARGYATLTLEQFHASLTEPGVRSRGREILITFDDAYEYVLEPVSALLREQDFTAVVFAPVAHLGSPNSWDPDDEQLRLLRVASGEALREAERGPWEVASHGFAHVDLTLLEATERRHQLRNARDQLAELLGHAVLDLAYPYGRHDSRVRADARATGYRCAFASGAADAADRYQLPRRAILGGEAERAFLIKASGAFATVLDRA